MHSGGGAIYFSNFDRFYMLPYQFVYFSVTKHLGFIDVLSTVIIRIVYLSMYVHLFLRSHTELLVFFTKILVVHFQYESCKKNVVRNDDQFCWRSTHILLAGTRLDNRFDSCGTQKSCWETLK